MCNVFLWFNSLAFKVKVIYLDQQSTHATTVENKWLVKAVHLKIDLYICESYISISGIF